MGFCSSCVGNTINPFLSDGTGTALISHSSLPVVRSPLNRPRFRLLFVVVLLQRYAYVSRLVRTLSRGARTQGTERCSVPLFLSLESCMRYTHPLCRTSYKEPVDPRSLRCRGSSLSRGEPSRLIDDFFAVIQFDPSSIFCPFRDLRE